MHLFYEFKDKIVRIRYQIVSLLFVITVLPIAFLQILNYWETSQKLQMKDVALLEDNLFLTQKILNSMPRFSFRFPRMPPVQIPYLR